MKALQQEQTDVLEEQRRIEWLESVGGGTAREDSGCRQEPEPIRLYGQWQENGFFSKDNEKPKGSVKQESSKAWFAFCCVFLDLSSCCMQNRPERSSREWKQREGVSQGRKIVACHGGQRWRWREEGKSEVCSG